MVNALRRGPLHSHDAHIHLHIADPAARVRDLKRKGLVIHSKTERRNGAHGVLYTLVGPATGVGGSQSAPDPGVRPDTQYLSPVEGLGGPPHSGSPAPSRLSPRAAGVLRSGRDLYEVWPVPPSRRQHPPAGDGPWEWVPFDALNREWWGRSYWRRMVPAEAAQEQMAVAV